MNSHGYGSADWDAAIHPVTFQPIYSLKIRGLRVNVELPLELFQDKLIDETEFMLLLLNESTRLSDVEIADAYTALRSKVASIPLT